MIVFQLATAPGLTGLHGRNALKPAGKELDQNLG